MRCARTSGLSPGGPFRLPPLRLSVWVVSAVALTLTVGCGGGKSSTLEWNGAPTRPDLSPEASESTVPSAEGFGRSPNGSLDLGVWQNRVVFSARPSGDTGNTEIFSATLEGGELRRHTGLTTADREPDWSPTHDRIVYVRSRNRGQPSGTFAEELFEQTDVFIMEADGSPLALPAKLSAGTFSDPEEREDALEETKKNALWKADDFKDGERFGVRVAYPRFDATGTVLVVMVVMDDGSTRLFLALASGGGTPFKLAAFGGPASWSKDGKQIVFSGRGAEDLTRRLYLVDRDGRNLTAITDPLVVSSETGGVVPRYFMDLLPAWSPDESSIVFSRISPVTVITPEGITRTSRLMRLTMVRASPDAPLKPLTGEDDKAVPPELLREDDRENTAVAFHRDGDSILFTRNETGGRLYEFSLSEPGRPPVPKEFPVSGTVLRIGASSWR